MSAGPPAKGAPPAIPAASGEGGGVFFGLLCLPKGAVYLVRHPRLWPWAVLPMIINLVVFTVVLYYAYEHGLPLVVDFLMPEKFPPWVPILVAAFLRRLVWIFSLVVLMLMGAISFTAVGTVVAAPFNDVLSERTEALVRGVAAQRATSVSNLMEDVARAIYQAARKMVVVLVVVLVTLPLLLVPVVGAVAYSVINGVVTTWFLGLEYIDLPMGRAGWSIQERSGWSWSRKTSVAGFGLGVYGTFLVPLLGFLSMPAAVVGGTLLFLELATPDELAKLDECCPEEPGA